QMETAAVLFMARSMTTGASEQTGLQVLELLQSGKTSWGETNLRDGVAEQGEDDVAGPVTVAMAVTKNIMEAGRLSDEARVVAYGDSDWLNNRNWQMQGNADLFLNTVNWMAAEEERIAIRPKSRTASQLMLSGEQMAQLRFFSMDLLP